MQAFGGGWQLVLGLGAMLFGLFIAGASVFAIYTTRSIWLDENFETLSWKKTPCVVDICEVEIDERPKGDAPFSLRLLYFYDIEGEPKASAEVGTAKSRSFDYEELSLLRRQLLSDPKFKWCYVNVKDPSEAVLTRTPMLSRILNLILPLILLLFAGVGFYVIWSGLSTWIALFRSDKNDLGSTALSTSPNTPPNLRRWGFAVFGFLLFLGVLSSYFAMLQPLKMKWHMASWAETPVTIKASNTGVGILYAYQIDGKDYDSNSYTYKSHVVGGIEGKQAILERYQVGSQQVGYVNPKVPEMAVFNTRSWFCACSSLRSGSLHFVLSRTAFSSHTSAN